MRLLRLFATLTTAGMALALLVVGLGRLLPGGARISFVQTLGANSDIYALDIQHSLRVNLTRSPAMDFGAAWSPDGTRMAFISTRATQIQLYLLTLGGGVRLLGDRVSSSYHPVWSPDGRFIVYESEVNNRRYLSLVEVDQPLAPDANPRTLTESQTDDRLPAWSPDGSRIAFVSWRDGNAEIYSINPDGGNLVNLTNNPGWDVSPAWSPDGTRIAFFAQRDRYRELYVMNRDGGGVRQLSNAQEVNNGNYWAAPVWSPDGKYIAYQTVIEGNPAIVVTPADAPPDEDVSDYQLVSAQKFDALPVWLPQDRGIVYMSGRGAHTALYLAEGEGGTPRLLTPENVASQYPILWMGAD